MTNDTIIYQLTLWVRGDDFIPQSIQISPDAPLKITDKWDASTPVVFNGKDLGFNIGHGGMEFRHKRSPLGVTSENRLSYERDFVNFMISYTSLFRKYGATRSDLYMEIFYEVDNPFPSTTLLSGESLKNIANLPIATYLPISFYKEKTVDFLDYLKELSAISC